MNADKSTLPMKSHSNGSFIWQFLRLGVVAIVLLLLLIIYIVKVDCNTALGSSTCTRVLFIGNSFTYVNNLPGTFTSLARAGGHKVATGMSAPGGWSLEQHASSQETLSQIENNSWDYVILQEQSQTPASAQARSQTMYPAARALVEKVRAAGAEPLFFVTWAHQSGWPEMGLDNFESMQSQINLGYKSIAKELKVTAVPVGNAWVLEHRFNPQLQLWNSDGYHPEPAGTYLAACVFYAVLFNESPIGLRYYAGLSESTAKELQRQAEQAVFGTQ